MPWWRGVPHPGLTHLRVVGYLSGMTTNTAPATPAHVAALRVIRDHTELSPCPVHHSTLRALAARGLVTLHRYGRGRGSWTRAVLTDAGLDAVIEPATPGDDDRAYAVHPLDEDVTPARDIPADTAFRVGVLTAAAHQRAVTVYGEAAPDLTDAVTAVWRQAAAWWRVESRGGAELRTDADVAELAGDLVDYVDEQAVSIVSGLVNLSDRARALATVLADLAGPGDDDGS